jgi:hypothetical protein
MKQALFKTAQASIGCAKFPAGSFVSVKYSHTGANGTDWYEIDRSQHGKLDSPVMDPGPHLNRFTL